MLPNIDLHFYPRFKKEGYRIPDGRSNSPTFGHFKLPHPDERVRAH